MLGRWCVTSTVRVTCFLWYVLSVRMFLPLSCPVNFMLPLFISLSLSLSLSLPLLITLSLSLNHSLSLFLYFFMSVSPTHCFILYSPLLNFRFSASRWALWVCMQAWFIMITSHWASTSSDRIINSCQKNLVQRCGALVIIFMFMYLFPCVHALFESSWVYDISGSKRF